MVFVLWLGFDLTMDNNVKNTEDDSYNCMFVVGGASFSTIFKSNKSIWYIMGVEFAWGDFLMGLMGCSSVKAKGIYDGILRAAVKVVHGVLDTLEHRYRWGSRIARDTVVRVYDIRVCILNNMHFFPICALNFLS